MIGLLKMPLLICQSRWKQIRNDFFWVHWGARTRQSRPFLLCDRFGLSTDQELQSSSMYLWVVLQKKKNMLCMLGYKCCFAEVVKLVCDAALKTLDNMPYRFFQTDISLYLLFSLFLFCVIFGIFIWINTSKKVWLKLVYWEKFWLWNLLWRFPKCLSLH